MKPVDYNAYCEHLIPDLREFIRIPTVYDSSTISAACPYGRAVSEGLDFIRTLARRDGFTVKEYANHALAVILNPSSPQIPGRVDILSHLDVVEPGTGWTMDPFCGSIINGRLYGRGAQDMKTPLLLTYQALKIIRDLNIPIGRELRVVIGCDEERTMEDMVYYIKQAGQPAFGFTPDGLFPLSLGEKGALMWRIYGEAETPVIEFNGGVQCNVVPPTAFCLVKRGSPEVLKRTLNELGLKGSVKKAGDFIEIRVEGRGAHASAPEKGENAIISLCRCLEKALGDPFSGRIVKIFGNYYGKGAGIEMNIPPMGRLTLSLGVLRLKDGKVYGEIDSRYPAGTTGKLLTDKVASAALPFTVSLDYDTPAVLNSRNSPYIKALLKTYRGVSGDFLSEPAISGGVTYSKVVNNCVAFGPNFPGEETLAHRADESIALDIFPKLLEVYTRAMISLANLPEAEEDL